MIKIINSPAVNAGRDRMQYDCGYSQVDKLTVPEQEVQVMMIRAMCWQGCLFK